MGNWRSLPTLQCWWFLDPSTMLVKKFLRGNNLLTSPGLFQFLLHLRNVIFQNTVTPRNTGVYHLRTRNARGKCWTEWEFVAFKKIKSALLGIVQIAFDPPLSVIGILLGHSFLPSWQAFWPSENHENELRKKVCHKPLGKRLHSGFEFRVQQDF